MKNITLYLILTVLFCRIHCIGDEAQETFSDEFKPPFSHFIEKEAEPSFSSEPYIHPKLVEELSLFHVFTFSPERLERIVAVSLSSSYDEPVFHHLDWVSYERSESDSFPDTFSYRFIGKMENGIHVLLTSEQGGGTGRFMNFLYLVFEKDNAFDPDTTHLAERIIVKRVGDYYLGDRWYGDAEVKGNKIFVSAGGWHPCYYNTHEAYEIDLSEYQGPKPPVNLLPDISAKWPGVRRFDDFFSRNKSALVILRICMMKRP